MTRRSSTPVLVIGAGPAGLVTSLVLARHGVRSTLVERHPGTSIHPRASAISLRSMEIFRRLGLEDEIRAFSLDVEPLMSLSATFASTERQLIPLGFPTRSQAAAFGPTGPALSPQDHVEPVLLRAVHALGLTDVRFGTELTGLVETPSGVEATVVDRVTGGRDVIRADYVVGADGGRSTVRDLVRIDVIGPAEIERYASVLFRAPLWAHAGQPRYGLYMVGEPGRRPAILAPMGPDDRWVLGWPGTPERVDELVADDELARAAIRAAAGIPDLDVEVLASMPLVFGAQLATRWRAGRVFLAGDAAHRMPPFGGRGMNTAVADAWNLGWKLAAVASGAADASLLDSYEAERGPVGRHNVALAISRFPELAAAHGLSLDRAMPGGTSGTPDGLLEDAGYVYRSAAIVPASAASTPPTASMSGTVAQPGGRIPHAWLETAGGRVSTVDLAGDGFSLVAVGTGPAWRRAARPFAGPGGSPARSPASPRRCRPCRPSCSGSSSSARTPSMRGRSRPPPASARGVPCSFGRTVTSRLVGSRRPRTRLRSSATRWTSRSGTRTHRRWGSVSPSRRRRPTLSLLPCPPGAPPSARPPDVSAAWAQPAASASTTGANASTASSRFGRSWTWTWAMPSSPYRRRAAASSAGVPRSSRSSGGVPSGGTIVRTSASAERGRVRRIAAGRRAGGVDGGEHRDQLLRRPHPGVPLVGELRREPEHARAGRADHHGRSGRARSARCDGRAPRLDELAHRGRRDPGGAST